MPAHQCRSRRGRAGDRAAQVANALGVALSPLAFFGALGMPAVGGVHRSVWMALVALALVLAVLVWRVQRRP